MWKRIVGERGEMAEKEMATAEWKKERKVKESAGVLITRYIDDVSPVFMNNFPARKWKLKKNKNDDREFSKCALSRVIYYEIVSQPISTIY